MLRYKRTTAQRSAKRANIVGVTCANRDRATLPAILLFMVGLDFHEIKNLLLAKAIAGLVCIDPIRKNQFCRGAFSSKHFPMISDPDGYFGFGVGGIHFGKRLLRVEFAAAQIDGADKLQRLLLFFSLWIDQVAVIA